MIDPACGSGAFLVYVFDYLMAENQRVGDILGNTIFSTDEYVKDILRNNIYGVDLNEESVEITKLSLWLKSAQKGKKLTSLDDNIKCGNSLIDDSEVAGNKAFNWHTEFAEIFKNGGFDIVVGNPPYVDSESMTKNVPKERIWLTANYRTARGNWDLFVLFVQKGVDVLKACGYSSMIMPNKILSAPYAKALRQYISTKYKLIGITDVTKEGVFDVGVYPIITNIKNDTTSLRLTVRDGVKEVISKDSIENTNLPDNWALLLSGNSQIVHKVGTQRLGDMFSTAAAATVAEAYELKEILSENKDAISGKIINTGTIDPYTTDWGVSSMNYIKDKYKHPYVDLAELREKEWHDLNKIIVAGMALRIEAVYSNGNEYLPAKSTAVIYRKDNNENSLKSLLALLNSKYASYLFKQANSQLSMAGGYMNVNANNLSGLQIPIAITANPMLAKHANENLKLSIKLQTKAHSFKRLVMSEFDTEKWPTKLSKWWMLDFTDFVKFLKLKLSLQQKDELLQLFEKYRIECIKLDNQIKKTNYEIDQLVYKLYGLSKDEVEIIEQKND